jgi:hypothetical protein
MLPISGNHFTETFNQIYLNYRDTREFFTKRFTILLKEIFVSVSWRLTTTPKYFPDLVLPQFYVMYVILSRLTDEANCFSVPAMS